jgi:hypothetical protein
VKSSRLRLIVYPHLLSVAIILTLLPLVVLPDIAGPMATRAGSDLLTPYVGALVRPPEAVWRLLGKAGTFDSVSCAAAPCMEWHRPPAFCRMALRHAQAAVPFWFFAQGAVLEAFLFARARRMPKPLPSAQ